MNVKIPRELAKRVKLYAIEKYGSVKAVSQAVAELLAKGLETAEREGKSGKRYQIAEKVLEEEGFVVESSIRGKAKDVDALFAKLKEKGALIIETELGRIAVHPALWVRFSEAMEEAGSTPVQKLRSMEEGEKMLKLLSWLSRAKAILYDGARWHLPEPQ